MVIDVLGGNIVLKVILLQVVMAALVLFLMKKLLERELLGVALEQIAGAPLEHGVIVNEVVVVAAGRFSGDDEFRLRGVIRDRFPQARVLIGRDASLGGGLIIRMGDHVLDHSLWTRLKQLMGLQGG